jgi:hypothetical protein
MFATQEEIDSVVERCKLLVNLYGGQSVELVEVRKWYEIFQNLSEHGSLVVLEAEVAKVENLNIKEHHASFS